MDLLVEDSLSGLFCSLSLYSCLLSHFLRSNHPHRISLFFTVFYPRMFGTLICPDRIVHFPFSKINELILFFLYLILGKFRSDLVKGNLWSSLQTNQWNLKGYRKSWRSIISWTHLLYLHLTFVFLQIYFILLNLLKRVGWYWKDLQKFYAL